MKHAIIKESEFFTKRNLENIKEEEGPLIRKEIGELREKK